MSKRSGTGESHRAGQGIKKAKVNQRQASDMLRNSSKAGFDGWRLHIEKQPPEYPFKEDAFDIQVLLLDGRGNIFKSGNPLPIKLRLLTDDKNEVKNGLEVVQPRNLQIDKSGSVRISVKVNTLSSDVGNKKFVFGVNPLPCKSFELKKVQPAISQEMKVVKYRLSIVGSIPDTWYKDQGGRENCIRVRVRLDGPKDNPCTEDVPLNVSLVYDDYTKVRDPEKKLLQITSEGPLVIKSSTNEAEVRARISDVSKNHQSKCFRFLVEPKKTTHVPDIARVVSERVRVMSKVNKKKPKASGGATNGHQTYESSVVNKLMHATEPAQISAMFPNATSDGKLRLPASAVTRDGEYEVAATDTSQDPALTTALWCDQVKDTIFELQQLAALRIRMENKLWKLMSDYDTVRPHLQEQLNAGKSQVATGAADRQQPVPQNSIALNRDTSLLRGFSMLNRDNSTGEGAMMPSSSMTMLINSLGGVASHGQLNPHSRLVSASNPGQHRLGAMDSLGLNRQTSQEVNVNSLFAFGNSSLKKSGPSSQSYERLQQEFESRGQ